MHHYEDEQAEHQHDVPVEGVVVEITEGRINDGGANYCARQCHSAATL